MWLIDLTWPLHGATVGDVIQRAFVLWIFLRSPGIAASAIIALMRDTTKENNEDEET